MAKRSVRKAFKDFGSPQSRCDINFCLQTNDSQKWRLLAENEAYQLTLPKSNSGCLAAGLYRIRSLDGTVFISLTDPEAEADSDESDVEPRAKCTNPLAYAASKEQPVKSQKVKLQRKPSVILPFRKEQFS